MPRIFNTSARAAAYRMRRIARVTIRATKGRDRGSSSSKGPTLRIDRSAIHSRLFSNNSPQMKLKTYIGIFNEKCDNCRPLTKYFVFQPEMQDHLESKPVVDYHQSKYLELAENLQSENKVYNFQPKEIQCGHVQLSRIHLLHQRAYCGR